jgi:hypothetical protein
LGWSSGCKHPSDRPPEFFDATAEYHRSDESSDPFAGPVVERCMRGAEHRAATKGRLRIRLSKLHPRVGFEGQAFQREQARGRTPEGAGSPNAFHSHTAPS